MPDWTTTTALSFQNHAFFFDFDGTLVELASTPDNVKVLTGVVASLGQLQQHTGGAVAVVTGRQLAVVDHMLSPLRLAGAGIHGLEHRQHADSLLHEIADASRLDPMRAELAAWATALPGLLIEDKGQSIAVHFRAQPDLADRVLRRLEDMQAISPGTITLQHGKMVSEIRLTGPDKGHAVKRLMAAPPFAGRIPVFFGDDVTDEAAFGAVQAAGGLGVFVGPPGGTTTALARLSGPSEVHDLLHQLVLGHAVHLPAIANHDFAGPLP